MSNKNTKKNQNFFKKTPWLTFSLFTKANMKGNYYQWMLLR